MHRPVEADADRWGMTRSRLVAGALALVFAVIVGRAGQIALVNEASASSGATATEARRANIVDRNGDLLATSLSAWTLAADPGKIWDAREVAQGIAQVLPGIDVEALSERLSNSNRKYALIRRGLTPRQRQAVMELGLEGVYFESEMRRVYPAGRLAGHLLGFTDVDGRGIEGLEYVFNDRLSEGGEPLRLTIDASVQYALESELELASEEFVMAGATGMVIDAHTGAVRAMASWPFIDPNHPARIEKDALRNRAVTGCWTGSVYKPLTVAGALEAGAVQAAICSMSPSRCALDPRRSPTATSSNTPMRSAFATSSSTLQTLALRRSQAAWASRRIASFLINSGCWADLITSVRARRRPCRRRAGPSWPQRRSAMGTGFPWRRSHSP